MSKHKQTTLTKVIRYLRNNRDFMHYQTYLMQGYPIGTGVIEGACRHLVKDRFERAGMRWSEAGAQVMLDLRAVYLKVIGMIFNAFGDNKHIKNAMDHCTLLFYPKTSC